MLKMKAYKFILKVTKFQLPTLYHFSTPFAVLAQQREEHECEWIPPPSRLIRVNKPNKAPLSDSFTLQRKLVCSMFSQFILPGFLTHVPSMHA